MIAYLYLEDGSVVEGKAFGAVKETMAEVVFNTAMAGYEEILTDPSYRKQAVVMTYPLIGNYGINTKDMESDRIQVECFIVKEACKTPNHYQCLKTVDQFLKEQNIPGIEGVDTRMLAKKIRSKGTMKGLLTYEPQDQPQKLLAQYQFPKDVAKEAGTKQKQVLSAKGPRVGLWDLGNKKGIVGALKAAGCEVVIYPYDTSLEEIQGDDLKGLLLSNGPGDPKDNPEILGKIKQLIGTMPLWGICLGHQLLALALGADTFKMKFGHRGGNHPVMDTKSEKVMMTAQNHGYEVDSKSMPEDVTVTYRNVNDGTIEGFRCEKVGIEAVQFHPEEGPGPVDAYPIVKQWITVVGEGE
ncbi:MAG TPA: carbamoyl phosphate synthase small subunit [Eubacteriaceae bacterium]|nr:carbamoyl phosphate synthase small subunit [Eubacteriaceae bacterium]